MEKRNFWKVSSRTDRCLRCHGDFILGTFPTFEIPSTGLPNATGAFKASNVSEFDQPVLDAHDIFPLYTVFRAQVVYSTKLSGLTRNEIHVRALKPLRFEKVVAYRWRVQSLAWQLLVCMRAA